MSRASSSPAAVVGFLEGVRTWLERTVDSPDVVDIGARDRTPWIVLQAPADEIEAGSDVGEDLRLLLGGCAGVFEHVEYAVDEAVIAVVATDRETHPGAFQWRLKAEWAREHIAGDLSTSELLGRVADTAEQLEEV